MVHAPGAKESVCELRIGGIRSARLQAGMCLHLQCRPEGRRYKSIPQASSQQTLKPSFYRRFDVTAEAVTHKADS